MLQLLDFFNILLNVETQDTPDCFERKYAEVFDSVHAGLLRRRRIDPEFTKDAAMGVLRHLYVLEGNDQLGRGELQDTVIRAEIQAFESFIAQWVED